MPPRRSDRSLVAALALGIAVGIASMGCTPSVVSFLVDPSRAPTPDNVEIAFVGPDLPKGFRALAVLAGEGSWSSLGNPPMRDAFEREARARGCTVVVNTDDGRGLGTRPGRRGEAVCGVVEP